MVCPLFQKLPNMEVHNRIDEEDRTAENITRAEAKTMMNEGKSLWRRFDRSSTKKKRTKAIEGLEKFEQKTGISTEKHRFELEKYGEDPNFVSKKLERIKAAGTKHYKSLLDNSGAFDAEGEFGRNLQKEKLELVAYFSKLDLSEGDRHSNMIDVICNIDEMLKPKKKFMERYKKQTPYVKELFDKAMPRLALVGSKEALLDEVIEVVGGMEDQPEAVQKTFKTRSEKVTDPDKLARIKEEVTKEYKQLEGEYTKMLFKNMKYFGGEMQDTSAGKMTTTAKEFREWFQKRPSIADMKSNLKKLPQYINERKRLYEKRDKILENATDADRKHFENITNKMRRHELENYLKETLEPEIQRNNTLTATYDGEMIVARECGIDLYNGLERAQKKARFKTFPPEKQKVLLEAEKLEIADRRATVKEYMDLPEKFKNEGAFMQASSVTRLHMLDEAKKRYAKSKEASPFDIDTTSELDDEEIQTLSEGIDSSTGERIIKAAMKAQEQDSAMKALNLQMMTWNRVRRNIKEAEFKDQTQEERFDKDLAKWTRKPQDLDDVKQTSNRRMKGKVEFHKAAKQLYNKGFVTYSSGQMHERQDITDQDLERGNTNILEKHKRAKYATDIYFAHADGREPDSPMMMFQRVADKTLNKFIPIMLEEIAMQMGMSKIDALGFIKSNKAKANARNFMERKGYVDEELMDFKKAA